MPTTHHVTITRVIGDDDDAREERVRCRVRLYPATRRTWDGGGEPADAEVKALDGSALTSEEEEAAFDLAIEDAWLR